MGIKKHLNNIKNINWFATTTKGAELISKMNINGSDTRLLYYLLSKINEYNQVSIKTYKLIAKELNTSEATIKKAMINLKKNKLIIKDIDESKTLFVNPTFFYAGNYKDIEAKQIYFDECFNKKNKKD